MKTQAAWIMAAVLCTGAAAQTWAQGTNTTTGARHKPAGQMMDVSFEKMDANGDGKVTVDEFVAAHADAIKKRFAAMDANGDGVLTKDEVETVRGGQHHDKTAAAATATSENATGKVAAATSAARPATGPMAALSFEKMDVKGDGKVTLEEFQAAWATMLKGRFAAMDANGDGVLTKEEVEAAHASHRPQGQRHGGGTPPAANAPAGNPQP